MRWNGHHLLDDERVMGLMAEVLEAEQDGCDASPTSSVRDDRPAELSLEDVVAAGRGAFVWLDVIESLRNVTRDLGEGGAVPGIRPQELQDMADDRRLPSLRRNPATTASTAWNKESRPRPGAVTRPIRPLRPDSESGRIAVDGFDARQEAIVARPPRGAPTGSRGR